MQLPSSLVYNDLNGEEIKSVLKQRFAQVLDEVPFLRHHLTLPRVSMHLTVHLDQWADQQSVELDPQKRREVLKKIWDRMLDKMYRVEHTNSVNFTLYQPWIHGLQWIQGNDGLGPSAFGYNTSQFVPQIWIDK